MKPPGSGSWRSAAEQLCPSAARSWLAARAVLSCCFLLMQQKAFPSSLYPRNRQDPISLVMRQNKNMRHKAEAQMLAFTISFIPSVAQGFMASQNFPQHIFLAVPIYNFQGLVMQAERRCFAGVLLHFHFSRRSLLTQHVLLGTATPVEMSQLVCVRCCLDGKNCFWNV